ncbi:MAG TPA: ECF-type sigma factor [Gemmataceae bacterium]|nr:ECF-type sigma factor [Gemmataceae bacterium]
MAPEGSITRWLGPLQAGDAAAVQELWERYFRRLVGLARSKLQGLARRAADEQDVALSVFDTFCRNVQEGRFPQLADGEDLWRLLVFLTARKAARLRRDEGRLKRGGGKQALADGSAAACLEELLSREPTPEFAAEVAESCQRLLAALADAQLEEVARCKMEGYTTAEIAQRLKCSSRSIKRKVRLIRNLWEKEGLP